MIDSGINRRVRAALSRWSQGPRDEPGGGTVRLERLTGDASNRIYVRVHLGSRWADRAGSTSVMAMVLPVSPAASEEIGSHGAHHGRLPFAEMADWLELRGVPVPRRLSFDEDERVLLLEDLGDLTLERALESGGHKRLYRQAVDLLIDFQRATDAPEADLIASQRSMNRDVLSWELDHYVEWRLEVDLSVAPGPWRSALRRAFDGLLDELCALPTRLVHRDFQSRNLMLGHRGGFRLIDFQDALIGPYIYDVVALLRDSYVVLDDGLVNRLLTRYAESAREARLVDASDAEIRRAFHLQTVQRKLKDTGRFVFIDRVKGNPSFLPYREPSMGYVRRALEVLDGHGTLRELLAELDPE